MNFAYRTTKEVIDEFLGEVTEKEINAFREKKKAFKKILRPFVLPNDGIVKGDTLREQYFPVLQDEGIPYDIFISHSHLNEKEAVLLATWIEKRFPNLSCFIDSFAWGSADQLLREIDDKYCWKKHSKTYDYKKRNFTTSHVHAILSMSLLDIIRASKYCIFIESEESISLLNGLKKKTFSPWLYEEIRFMKLLQPERKTILCSEGATIEKAFKCAYDVSSIEAFPYLNCRGIKEVMHEIANR